MASSEKHSKEFLSDETSVIDINIDSILNRVSAQIEGKILGEG